jgi:hypothetical protein
MVPAVAGRIRLQVDRVAATAHSSRDIRIFRKQRERNVAGAPIGN